MTATYFVGVALLLTRLLRSAWYTRRLGRFASEATDADLMNLMKAHSQQLGLQVLPVVPWCQQVSVPIVTGVVRPVVLLPAYAATGLTIDHLQAVIAHELAHIRRYDLFINVLQRVDESLLFFHPAVWWVSPQMANEREQACNELDLKVGTGRAQYADALVKMAELSIEYSQPPVTALASSCSSTTAFKRRILKVLQIDPSPSIRPGRMAAVVSSVAVLLLLATLIIRGGALDSGTIAVRDGNTPEKTSLEDEPVAQSPSPEKSVPPQVELIGLTYDQSLKQAWQPNGQPIPVPDWVRQLPKLIAVDRGLPPPLFLFEIHGLREKPSIQYQHKTAIVSGDTELPIGRAYRQVILFDDLKNNSRPNWSDAPTMFLSDEAWGPWRKINRDGQFSDPVDENGFYRNAYAEVSSLGIRPLKTNAKTAVDGTAPQGLVLKYPAEFIRRYAIEIEAIPAAHSNGQPTLLQASILDEQSSGVEKVLEVEWPVDPISLDHLRMRVRPFRHKYVFENVNYAASQSPKNYTQFNTVYTKMNHDLSKPEDAETPPSPDVSAMPQMPAAAPSNSETSIAGAARTFPTRFADEFISRLRTRTSRDQQSFLNQSLFEEVRANTIAFLSATTQVAPSLEQQQAIIDSMIGQVTDPNNPSYGRFGNYLAFGNAYKDLMWRVQAAAVRKSLTKAELSAVMSGLRDLATPPLPWPDLIVGSGGTVEYKIHEFQSEQIFLGATEKLGSVEDEKSPSVVHLDQAKLLSWPKRDVPTEAAFQVWVNEHGSGDVGFVPSRDELVAFKKGKLLKLDTSDWWAIDQLNDDELRARIEREGGETVSMADYPKHGFRAIAPDPPLIAIRTGPFAGQGQLFVFAVDATDMGMHLHIRSRPGPKRLLDLLKVPQSMSVLHGPSWQGLRTSLSLATEPSGPDAPQLGRLLVNLDLFNGSNYPQAVALDPAQVSNWFDIYGPSGHLIPGLVARLPIDLPRDEKGNVIARTIQPGQSLRLLENVNLGLAYPLAEPGQYQITFGGQERTISLSHGRSCPQSNLLTIDVAAGSIPLIHKYWRLFNGKPIAPPAQNWSLHHASVADSQTLAFRRPDYVYTNWVILTFTDTAEPVPEQKWTPFGFGIDVNRPWPKPRDVLLGKTEIGFAHLLLPPLADKEWPACEEQIKERMREHLRPVTH